MTTRAPPPPPDADDRAIRAWAVEEARRVVFQAQFKPWVRADAELDREELRPIYSVQL